MSTDGGPSAESARDLVRDIAKQRGYLGEDQLARIGAIEPELRREVEEALLRKDEMIGSAVLTLARNLYTSNARFVFELLQNADDNNYSAALAAGATPYVSFNISPGKVCIECNENGFTRENLGAICAIGKSSKVGATGYIGEKGIGFKSVFMAAWKVHIQSNSFSFSFTHRKGDSGLGMVTPVWEETDEVLGDSLTRITLYLHTSDDPDEDARQRETIRLQFLDLQHTILLFLRKLRKVTVNFRDDDDGVLASSTEYSLHGQNPTTVRKTTSSEVEEKRYHVTRHVDQNIPRSENRTYSEESERADSSAEIVLAFPLTDTSSPIIDNQDVFAFLPMRPMGFKFLIHTDFVTEASRQGLVTTSLRNKALLNGIAECFIRAIQEFCQHPTLQYQWMRWLPQRDSYPWEGFWIALLDRIEERIKQVKVLRTLGQGKLDFISHLSQLQSWLRDGNGDPLFMDTDKEVYLAKEYTADDLRLLTPYGLGHMSGAEIIDRVQQDLEKPSRISRMKNPATKEEWHSLAARALVLLKDKAKLDSLQDRIGSLELIPLEDGRWVSADSGQLYYSHCSGHLKIPGDLNFSLVDPEAANNPARRTLFDKLGVVEAVVKQVRARIFYTHLPLQGNQVNLANSIRHLKFLYLSEGLVESAEDQHKLQALHVYNQLMQACNAFRNDVYLTTDDHYGPSSLFRATTHDIGFKACFLHDGYLKDHLATPAGFHLSWVEWIERRLSIRRHVRLIEECQGGKLEVSKAFRWIEGHRSAKLLGALERVWSLEVDQIRRSPHIIEELRDMEVECKGVDEFGTKETLSSTYLPLPELEVKHARYAEGEQFNFLELGEPVTMRNYRPKWSFLVDDLGVGDIDDLDFYLSILRSIREYSRASSVRRSPRILDLYEIIYTPCRDAQSFLDARDKVRKAIVHSNLIYIPAHKGKPAAWTSPEKCLWSARDDMQTVYPLEHLYRTHFSRSDTDLDILRQFFKNTLNVPDCSWNHYLAEIRRLKSDGSEDFDWISDLYCSIDDIRQGLMGMDLTSLKKAFANEPLIYVNFGNSSQWYTAEQCLWSSATQIRGRVALNDLYPDLESFFVDFLDVQELTLEMAYDELKQMGERTPSPSIAAVKETIWALNSLLISAHSFPNGKPIFSGNVFPVRYPNGPVRLQTGQTQFAIADRKSLGDVFSSQAKILDFDLDEIRRLKPFFSWLELEMRYLSSMVKEISTVDGGRMSGLSQPDREIRQRADGLYRIAVHFNSPRTMGNNVDLYWTLYNTQVHETDGISSELHLSQDGHDLVHVQERSELHLREDDGALKVYVPRDPKTQGFCYFSTLPRRLLEWMMADPATQIAKSAGSRAVHVVSSVLNAPMINMTQILEAEGIVDVDIPEQSITEDVESSAGSEESAELEGFLEQEEDDESGDTVEYEAEEDLVERFPSQLKIHTDHDDTNDDAGSGLDQFANAPPRWEDLPVRQMSPATSHSSITGRRTLTPTSFTAQPARFNHHSTPDETPDVSTPGRQTAAHPAFVFGSSPAQADSAFQFQGVGGRPAEPGVEDDAQYLRHVNNIISAASTAIFPAKGVFDMSRLFGALPLQDDAGGELLQRFGTGAPRERDMKVGALGELFVFELLYNLKPSLSRFGRENWQSLMRKYVTVHPNYSDMLPWTGRETADIVYFDHKSALTALLVDKGYLDKRAWMNKKPLYLIEVKATTGPCRTPFFVSRRQYERMKENSISTLSPATWPTIYMIARVFDVGKTKVDMKLYLDPENMRQEGSLVFTAETYSVVPGLGSS